MKISMTAFNFFKVTLFCSIVACKNTVPLTSRTLGNTSEHPIDPAIVSMADPASVIASGFNLLTGGIQSGNRCVVGVPKIAAGPGMQLTDEDSATLATGNDDPFSDLDQDEDFVELHRTSPADSAHRDTPPVLKLDESTGMADKIKKIELTVKVARNSSDLLRDLKVSANADLGIKGFKGNISAALAKQRQSNAAGAMLMIDVQVFGKTMGRDDQNFNYYLKPSYVNQLRSTKDTEKAKRDFFHSCGDAWVTHVAVGGRFIATMDVSSLSQKELSQLDGKASASFLDFASAQGSLDNLKNSGQATQVSNLQVKMIGGADIGITAQAEIKDLRGVIVEIDRWLANVRKNPVITQVIVSSYSGVEFLDNGQPTALNSSELLDTSEAVQNFRGASAEYLQARFDELTLEAVKNEGQYRGSYEKVQAVAETLGRQLKDCAEFFPKKSCADFIRYDGKGLAFPEYPGDPFICSINKDGLKAYQVGKSCVDAQPYHEYFFGSSETTDGKNCLADVVYTNGNSKDDEYLKGRGRSRKQAPTITANLFLAAPEAEVSSKGDVNFPNLVKVERWFHRDKDGCAYHANYFGDSKPSSEWWSIDEGQGFYIARRPSEKFTTPLYQWIKMRDYAEGKHYFLTKMITPTSCNCMHTSERAKECKFLTSNGYWCTPAPVGFAFPGPGANEQ